MFEKVSDYRLNWVFFFRRRLVIFFVAKSASSVHFRAGRDNILFLSGFCGNRITFLFFRWWRQCISATLRSGRTAVFSIIHFRFDFRVLIVGILMKKEKCEMKFIVKLSNNLITCVSVMIFLSPTDGPTSITLADFATIDWDSSSSSFASLSLTPCWKKKNVKKYLLLKLGYPFAS